ncbi:hypothetical protein FOT90_00970 [Klebsiella aerogenes]|uniref:hypothetical protein n=1 Tax=Klebsiella aerogenes TaxID=548 RepID=UPI00177C4EA5|nr:hypothetical protein [Klebsiella aerogenes]MBE0184147.1 hypothetical protein [Klebsiella aerogenes]MBE0245990.1 hypothetical protein [Klebsiella aerogenes]
MSYTIEQLEDALVRADAAGDTASAQILADELASRQADRYVKSQPESLWSDFKHGAGELLDGWIHEGMLASPAAAEFVARSDAAGIKPEGATSESIHGGNGFANMTPEPKTITGSLVAATPKLLAALPGWEAGAGELAGSMITKETPKLARWAAKGLGGTLGSDITSGEDITAGNLAAGTAANVAMESILHIPDALRVTKTLLARNGTAIQEAADHIGVTPSMGVTTSRQWLRTLENLIHKVPGGHLVNIQNAKSLKTMDSFITGIKTKLGYNGDASALGREIRAAIENAEKDFDKESGDIYDAIVKKAGKYQQTNTRGFTRKVEELAGVNPRPGIDKMTTAPIARKYNALLEEAGKIPQNSGFSNVVMGLTDARNALKLLDDYIGTGESATADTAAAKQMAAELRDDINGTFDALGLGAEWRAAQDRYAAGKTLLEQARAVLGRAETGDAIYTRLFGNETGIFSAKGVDTLRPIKQLMNDDEWNHVAAEVIHRMGLEGAGTAAAEGREFNPSVFLTNWNKLNTPAKELLFSAGHHYDLEQVAKLSEGFKNLGRDANNSGTAHHLVLAAMAGAALNPALWPKLALGVAGSTALGKLLINPKATRLLVDSAYATEPNQVKQWMVRLVALAAAHPELAQAIASLGDDEQ